jgi:hypothetical protein
VSPSRTPDEPFDAARTALSEQLRELDEQLQSYDELVEKRRRLTGALAALDGGTGTKKRVRWQEVAAYVADHPGSMPAEIAAALEVPRANVQAHLVRNEGAVFERRGDGWHVVEGWETQRRDGAGR